jgi:regulator of replication initiation timing
MYTLAVIILVIDVFVIIGSIIGLVVCLVEYWEEQREIKSYATHLLTEQFALNLEATAARKAMLDESVKHRNTRH